MRRSFICVIALICIQNAFAQTDAAKTKTIEAVIRKEKWAGWGGGEPMPKDLIATQAAQKFERVANAAGQNATFSGKVLGLAAGAPAEIGIVSLIGVQWTNNENYEWTPIKEDGSFDVKAEKHPEARHTLVVKSEGHPWTFLRAELEAKESGKNIEITMPPDKQVVLTVQQPNGKQAPGFAVEVFNAYEVFDDAGKKLRAERSGRFNSQQGELVLPVPMEPIAVLIAANGMAPYYHVLDPREADQFVFKLFAEGKITGTVTKDGKPVANESVFMVNEAAPLSASLRKTDKDGKFSVAGRVPGTHMIKCRDKEQTIEVKAGETTDAPFDITGSPEPQK